MEFTTLKLKQIDTDCRGHSLGFTHALVTAGAFLI